MDLDKFLEQLDKNSEATFKLVQDCTTVQLHYPPSSRWSIMQVLEHVCITEKLVGNLLLTPFETVAPGHTVLGEEKLRKLIVRDTEHKVKAPESLQPKGEITDIQTFERTFLYQRNQLKKNLLTGQIVIDNRSRKHPFLGEMTVSDWLYFIPFHNERHQAQISSILESMNVNAL